MAWPTGQEYGEVIQNPHLAFEDPELQAGRIETDRLGLPRPRSGNSAVVYRLDCGMRSWAVKCFTREVADQQRRYAAISAHLRASTSPYMVGFEYFGRGIRVRGRWFPILKMEWVSGDSLIRYVDNRLRDPSSIRGLAARWVAMVKALRAQGIAHGDLQHGNVLVVGDDLKLVDYDGMFVPALAGAPAIEIGHPNYQHPERSSLPFGPTLDNFSAWSVYVSLIALSIDPSLRSSAKADDDCLLFRARDFAEPDCSRVLRTLESCQDEGLRFLIGVFGELLRLNADQVPPLDAAKIPVGRSLGEQSHRSGSWLDDHVKVASAAAANASSTEISVRSEEIDASWVLDFVTPIATPVDARFTNGVVWLRWSLLSSVAFVTGALLIVPGLVWSTILIAVLIAVNLGLIAARYKTEPGVASLSFGSSGFRMGRPYDGDRLYSQGG